MNQRGFIPIIYIVIGAAVLASAVFGVVKYKDEIASNVSKIFERSEIIVPETVVPDEVVEPIEEPVEPVPEPKPEPKPQPKPKPKSEPAPAPEPEPAPVPAGSSDPAPAGEPEPEPEPEPVEPECTSDADCADENEYTNDNCIDNACYNQCPAGQTCDDDNSLTINDICFTWGTECICRGIAIECFDDNDCEDDDNSCTVSTCNDSGTEDASCSHTNITSCTNDDGCCASDCDATNDNDCEGNCGNGICEIEEDVDNCSTDCSPQCKDDRDNDGDGKIDFPADPGCEDDQDNDETDVIACYDHTDCMTNSCEVYFCENAGTGEAVCVFEDTITGCYPDGYGCCPSDCTSATDSDCQ